MSFQVKYLYDLVDQISPSLRKIQSNVQKTGQTVKSQSIKIGRNFDHIGDKMKKLAKRSGELGKGLFLKMTLPLGLLGGSFIKAAASMETLKTSFVGILGSAEEAAKMVDSLNEFTAKTPFQIDQVASSAKKLLASKEFTASQIPEALQMIGDLAAAADTDLQGLAAVFSKAAAKGKVQGEIFEMFNDRGIPVLAAMAEQIGVTKAEILDMGSKGQISFNDLLDATKKMTSEGGFAFQATILQSKTAAGIFSTLKDNIKLTSAAIGETFLPDLKEIAIRFIAMTQKIKEFAQENPRIFKMVLIFGALAAALPPLLITIGLMSLGVRGLALSFGLLKTAVLLSSRAFKALTLIMRVNPLMLMISAVAAAIVYWDDLKKIISSVWETVSDFFNFGNSNSFNLKTPELKQSISSNSMINQRQDVNLGGRLDINFSNMPRGTSARFTPVDSNPLPVGINPVYGGM